MSAFAGSKATKAQELPDDFYEQIKDQLYERIWQEVSFARRVLDVGCGACELARFLSERNGREVIGVDISEGAFPERLLAGGRVRCIKCDARNMKFLKDGTVDAAISVYALHEMEDPVVMLEEARRVLRSGGKLLVVDFPRHSLAQRLWNEHYYSRAEINDLLRQAGFARVSAVLVERGQLIWAKGFGAGVRSGLTSAGAKTSTRDG